MALAPIITSPIITSPLNTVVYRGFPFAYQIESPGATTFGYSYDPETGPAGIFVDSSTGMFGGSNYRSGTFDVQISAVGFSGTATATLRITVVEPNYATCQDQIVQQLYEARTNYVAQKLQLSTKKKPSYDIDGQKVDWVKYLQYIDSQIVAINGMIIAYEGPYEEITVGFT